MTNESIIEVKNVSKAVGDRQLLLDVSFTVAKGSLVSLIGPNGAGKSTLVKIILGLDTNCSGSAIVSKNERVQYIPQTTQSDAAELPLSVSEYFKIATTRFYGKPKSPADLIVALDHVGVSADKLHQSFASLSGGEKQRIAIARALLSDPSVLILDEPFAAVDYSARKGLYELVRHLQEEHDITTLLVSHDIDSILPISDRILCLNVTLNEDCMPSDSETIKNQIHHHC